MGAIGIDGCWMERRKRRGEMQMAPGVGWDMLNANGDSGGKYVHYKNMLFNGGNL
jgi:hypothetical protein